MTAVVSGGGSSRGIAPEATPGHPVDFSGQQVHCAIVFFCTCMVNRDELEVTHIVLVPPFLFVFHPSCAANSGYRCLGVCVSKRLSTIMSFRQQTGKILA